MDEHLKTSKSEQNRVKLFHHAIIIVYLIVSVIGIFYPYVAIISFQAMIFLAVGVYIYGLYSVKRIVEKFEMSIPNKQVTFLHVANMLLCCFLSFAFTTAEILMFKIVFLGNDLMVEEENVP